MKKLILFTMSVALAVVAVAPPASRAYPSDKEPRFSQLTMEQLNDQQRRVAEEIMKVSSVGLGGPYNPLLRSPVMADRTVKLLNYLRFNTSVPRKLNEFAILIQARLWTSQVEWYVHYPLAIKAGLPAAVAADLKEGKRPASMQADEAAVYDLCMELSTKHVASDADFKRARGMFSEKQLVDLVMLSGTYASLAMLINAAEEGVPMGNTPPLQPLSKEP
jgi:4-carboxymuconolactone decarboxylase